MADFQQIIKLRNEGKTQEEIAQFIGVSKRSVIRYLNTGKIPQYKRLRRTRLDPMDDLYGVAEEKIREFPKISITDLFEFLNAKGYQGSLRTLRRRTRELRQKYKNKEVFFQRETRPGEIMEGDFTEIQIEIGGIRKNLNLWVVSLPFSNTIFATPYYNQTFECFAEGSINAFRAFGGVATKYRLDNLSPAVTKILNGKNRLLTARYAKFQEHYVPSGFLQSRKGQRERQCRK